jgi:hypothetical protein
VGADGGVKGEHGGLFPDSKALTIFARERYIFEQETANSLPSDLHQKVCRFT